ncbi:MAG: DUF2723 domain-containing protein [Myxococcales bacterium]
MATATAHGGFFEEGALIAAAQSLGVAHPPGGLLTTLWSAVFAQLPIGPLSFRVSIGAAVCAAGLLAMFARAVFFSLIGAGVRDARRAAPLALASAWFVGQAPMFWLQAVRPNVFALQFLLSLVMVEALVRFELSEPTEDTRLLYFAAFVQGLSFANHHVYALWMLSAAAPTLGRVFARRGFVGMMGHVAFPILGFSASAYLPIRASQRPSSDFGDPGTLGNLYWYLNEDPWWGPAHAAPRSAWADLAHGLGGAHAWPFVVASVLALVAVWFALTARAFRRFALLWLLVLSVPFCSVAWLLKPQVLADAWGSLLPCALGLVALASVAFGLLLERVLVRSTAVRPSTSSAADSEPSTVPRRPLGSAALFSARGSAATLGPFWVLACVAGLAFFSGAEQRAAALVQPDRIDEIARRELPTRAVLLSYDAATAFRHLGAEAEEQLRADLVLVPLSWLHFPGLVDGLVDAHPELRALLSEHLMSKRLTLDKLQSLSVTRPVLLELSEQVPGSIYNTLISDPWFQRVLPDGATLSDSQSAASAHFAALSRLSLDMGGSEALPLALREQLQFELARMHFFHGLLAASHADLANAHESVLLGLRASPDDPALLRLEKQLPAKGRLSADSVLEPLTP